jgi:uncharacterized protein YdcH (DUF465 family)
MPVSSPTEAVREQLMANNSEFQRLREEHLRYAQRLDQLSGKNHLTDEEQLEEVLLKKKKLRVKDEMERMVHQAQPH